MTTRKFKYYSVTFALVLFFLNQGVLAQSLNLNIGAETGTVASGLVVPLVESYSKNGNSDVVDASGNPYVGDSLHNITAVAEQWAREGNYVIRVYADGSNYPNPDYAYRAELSDNPPSIAFYPGEERYYSISFYPPSNIWNNQTQYSTVITQWKQYGGGYPNARVSISNMGDYKLTIRSPRGHWTSAYSDGDVIGYAIPDQWNDMKYYIKHASDSTGVLKVWLNGELKFEHYGPTLHSASQGGYIKFGLYTGIRDERILYFDGINITDSITVPMNDWATDQLHLPTINLVSPADSAHLTSGSQITISATANDPAGNKLGTSGGVQHVEFFANNYSIGIDSISPYSMVWNPADGPYSIKAVVMDSDSNITTSNTANIFLGNKPPVVTITSPVHQTNYTPGDTVTIDATAVDPDGVVSQVEFFNGNTSIGIDSVAPFQVSWIPSDSGAYFLSAKATDSLGKLSSPFSLAITVGATIDTTQIIAIEDASLKDYDANANSNYSNVEILGRQGKRKVAIVKFNITSLINTPEILDARLRIYTHSFTDTVLISAYKAIGDNWSETSVTWNNGPTRGAAISNVSVEAVGATYEFDITGYLSEKIQDGDSLITIWLEDTLLVDRVMEFKSHTRSSGKPELFVKTSDISTANVPDSVPPVVSITAPAQSTTFAINDTITISATASDPGGQVMHVEFFEGSTSLGIDSVSPYSISWIPQGVGSYSFSVVATDNDSILSDTSSVSISVINNPPTATLTAPAHLAYFPANYSILITASASDPDGAIQQVEFFVGGSSLGTDTISPYSIPWLPLDSGTYTLSAIATDGLNMPSKEDSVTVTVYEGPQTPGVTLTSPAESAEFLVNENITISATANDIDGTVAQVEFFAGNTSIGVDSVSPYSISWAASDSGAYVLSAVATDNDNLSSAASSVNINVTATIDTAQLIAIEDASLKDYDPNANSNWSNVEIHGRPTQRKVAIFKFDISSLLNTPQVLDASLKLYTNSLTDTVLISAYKAVGDNWSETSVTWNNGPTRGTAITDVSIETAGTTYEFDITDYLSEKIQNGDSMITIWLEDTLLVDKIMAFKSHTRSSGKPELFIRTIDIPTAADTVPPVVSITSPAHQANFQLNDTVTVEASATDSAGSITQVEFFNGNTSIGIDSVSPYSINWLPPHNGVYFLRAIATDTDSLNSVPDTVAITVGATIDTTVVTSIHDGPVDDQNVNTNNEWSKVEIYSNSSRKVAALFKFDISSMQGAAEIRDAKLRVYPSSYSDSILVSAFKAIGDDWDETTVTYSTGPSRDAKITEVNVNQANQYFEFDVTDYIAEKITAGDSLVTIWLEDENRILKYTAFDSHVRSNPPQLEVTTSNLSITNLDSLAPEVTITSPANLDYFADDDTITISATADDLDGLVQQVEFFVDNVSIGIDSVSPYSVTWAPGDTGTFVLSAIATDNHGLSSLIDWVQITTLPVQELCTQIDSIKSKYEKWLIGENLDYTNFYVNRRYEKYGNNTSAHDLSAWDFNNPGPVYDLVNSGTDVNDFRNITQFRLWKLVMEYHSPGPASSPNAHYQDSVTLGKILDIFQYLEDRGINDSTTYYANSYPALGYTGIGGDRLRYTSYAHSVLMMKDELQAAGKFDHHIAALGHATSLIGPENIHDVFEFPGENTDHVRSLADSRFAYILAQECNDVTRAVNMNYFYRWMNNACQISNGWSSFIKADGMIFHHRGAYPIAYGENAITNAVKINYILNNTAYQLNSDAQANLKMAVMAYPKFVNKYNYPRSVTGRGPLSYNTYYTTLSMFAYTYLCDPVNNQDAAEEFLRLWDVTDPQILRLTDQTNSTFNLLHTPQNMQDMIDVVNSGLSPASAPNGSFNFPYAGLSVHKRDDWMVSIKGTSKHIWQHETLPSENMPGRYNSAGHMEMYTGSYASRDSSGFADDGWDWSRIPGTTVSYLDDAELVANYNVNDREYTDQVMLVNASFDDHSTFAMHYEDVMSPNLQSALKSVFFFDDVALCLGSNINNGDGSNPVQTTLFQSSLGNTPAVTYLNGSTLSSLGTNYSQAGGNIWCTDVVGNGFVIPAGTVNADNFHLTRSTQSHNNQADQGPYSGDFVTAWFDHGVSPSNNSYQYAIKVRGGATGTADLASNFSNTFEVLNQDSLAHIVKYVPDSIYSIAVFDTNYIDTTGTIPEFIAMDQPGVASLQVINGGNQLKLSVTNPDLGLLGANENYNWGEISGNPSLVFKEADKRPIIVALEDSTWQMFSNDYGSDAYVVSSGGISYVIFETIHGKTMQVILERSNALSLIASSTNPGCFGNADGAITLLGTGGAGSYQYSIDNGTTFQSLGTFSGLADGTYYVVVQDGNNDQVTDTIILAEPAEITATDVQTACDSYTWIDGNTYTSSNNTATYTLTNAAGCDSVLSLNLTVNSSNTGTDVITACDSYTWIDGNTYTASNNTATYTLTNSAGCDSVVTLNLTINSGNTGTDVITACDSYTWIDGNTYTASNNTATYTLTNAAGCDSVVTLNLTINSSNTGTDVITACDSYTWIDGNTYTASNNTATYTLTNAAGCDSVVTLNLTVNSSNTGTDVITACDSYTWIDGLTYTASNNTATYTLTNDNGCDSVVTLDLTINLSNTGTDVITACDSYTWIDGNTYTASNNTATYTLTNASGCDSVVTLNLTINSSNTGTDVITACDTYTWIDGNTYTASNNTATYTLTNVNGCDSVVTLDLTIISSNTGTDVITACDSYTWIDGNTYTASNNTATYTLTNAAGCDSVVTLNLTINSSNTGTDVITACDSYTWIDGNTYTASNNTATYTLTNVNGCDSVVTLNLTINSSNTGTDVITACDSYTWIDGNTYTASNNTATYTLTNAAGCDSVVTLNLTINSSNTGTDVITACDSYTWIDGNTYTASNNTATYTLTNAAGCDSVVTLNLTINSSNTGTDVITACDSYTWIDGLTYTASNNTATYTLTNTAGCDSVITLDLTINYSNTGTDVITACDSYTWIDGNTYTASNNTATYTLTNASGCDSVVTLDLTIESIDATVTLSGLTIYALPGYDTYQWYECTANGIVMLNNETNDSVVITANGDYAVVINNNNCSDTSDCVTINNIGFRENNQVSFILFPNPTEGMVKIERNNSISPIGIYQLQLVDSHGKMIQNSQVNFQDGFIVINLDNYPAGVYQLTLMNQHEVFHEKVSVVN